MILLTLMLMAAPPEGVTAGPMAGDRSRYNACLALAKSAPERAIETAQAWRIENGGTGAVHCLALAQFQRKDYTAAFRSFEAAAQASQRAGDGQAVVLLSQGADAALLAGQPEAAVKFLGEAIDGAGTAISPRVEAALRVTRAEALVDLKRDKEAAADLDRATAIDGQVADGWLLKATLARRMGDLKTAEAAILAAAGQSPDSAEVQYEAGNIAAAQGNMELAKTAWTAAASAGADSMAGAAAAKALQAAARP
ncbi:hypothetical protein [Polymorphobacter fuscus]|uniref:Uncharacterized protein n=1 Tax=Sandarakinorhabdus fusca TaxID=1439888 RepID=A0A7C9KIX7_9SPHN|nr:hypothetical protein [Polymorphobacter fuscus]KAB7645488.1 hypothetical protein F9290_11695 [Polymorphobacter fuscus]MQT17920.1 hypothetical protein [Polymorphobacter fuscus]NJC08550.1 tetratricopeptide (TPR) repeat protein [Polymorphobacter fuscus]